MTVTHRLGDEWLMAYAAGALTEGEAVMVATHLSFDPEAAIRLGAAEAVGAAMLEDLPAEPVADGALATVLDRLDGPEPAAAPAPRTGTRLPGPLFDYVGRDLDDLPWSFLGPGMRKVRLWDGPNDQRLWMLRAKPGTRIPHHGHNGTELTLVLQGSFSDVNGRFGPGDVEETDESLDHDLTIDPGEECVCLALTQGPIRFSGVIARAVQPFIGL